MLRRSFKFVSAASAVMLGATLILSIATFILNPWQHYISFSDTFHVGVWRGGDTLGRIVMFSDAGYGPYRGSLLQITDGDGNAFPVFDKEVRFGGSFGIYYRYFRREEWVLWTMVLSLWYPATLFSILPAIRLIVRRQSASDKHESGWKA
jgi:hypothetical protein